MKAVYFAWVRERIGLTDEVIAPPPSVRTVGDLIQWLVARGDNYAQAFEDRATIRAALDRRHVKHETMVGDAREVAFFPPMTGG